MDNEWKIVEMDGRQYREMTRTEKAESGGVVTLKICRPILTDKEFERQKAALLDALQQLGKSAIDQGIHIAKEERA